MKSRRELEELKEQLDNEEITVDDLDEETQEQLIELYKKEFLETRDNIEIIKEEIKMYEEKTEQVKEALKEIGRAHV